MEPMYAKNVISYVIYKGNKKWYVVDHEIWYLDLRKLIKSYEDKGHKIPNSEDFSDRFNIDIITDENKENFIEAISEYYITSDLLRKKLSNIKLEELLGYVPSIYVDFDRKILISNFPEPAGFENYVPDDWEGKYENFLPMVDKEDQFWLQGDESVF